MALNPKRWGKPLARGLGAVLSGVVLTLAFAPFNQGWVVWAWLVLLLPLLWTAPTKKAGFGLGYLAGLGCWLINVKWLNTVSWVGPLVLGGYLALYFGIFGAFAASVGNPWRKRLAVPKSLGEKGRAVGQSLLFAVGLGLVWSGLELLRGWVFTGYGWNGLGVAFFHVLPLAQLAELVGVNGLSVLPVFFSAVLVQVGGRIWWDSVREGARVLYWDLAIALGVLMGALSLGTTLSWRAMQGETHPVEVLLVQQDIPQFANRVAWEPVEVVDGFTELTEQALLADAEKQAEALVAKEETLVTLKPIDWVVWPEVALPEWFEKSRGGQASPALEGVLKYLRSLGSFTHLTGVMEYDEGKSWNSLLAIKPDGSRESAAKQHLVIFGEFIPEISWLRALYKHSAGVDYTSNLERGVGKETLKVMAGGREVEVMPSICFEDTVPRQMRKFAKPGVPQVMVNVTNDGWFQKSEGAEQHYQNSIFRAIELRRPLVRCANRGRTCVVSVTGSTLDPMTGERQELLGPDGTHFFRGALRSTVHVPTDPGMTLYARLGDWVALLGLLVGACWIAGRWGWGRIEAEKSAHNRN